MSGIEPKPHVCDYVDPEGTTTGWCHLDGPHNGRCPLCGYPAAGCAHQRHWELVLLCSVRDCQPHRA